MLTVQSKLPPLKKVTFVFTFHHEGVFPLPGTGAGIAGAPVIQRRAP